MSFMLLYVNPRTYTQTKHVENKILNDKHELV